MTVTRYVVRICRLDALSDLRGKNRTYENLKRAALAAGRFSVFDAETSRDARLLTRLHHDPEIEVFELPYPWIGVKGNAPAHPPAAAPKEQP